MDQSLTIASQFPNNLPSINREQLPAVVVRSLPQFISADQSEGKRAYVLNTPTQPYLRPLDLESEQQEPISPKVLDLEFFRSLFLFPLSYLRGTLIAAYQRARDLLSLKEGSSSRVDLYV